MDMWDVWEIEKSLSETYELIRSYSAKILKREEYCLPYLVEFLYNGYKREPASRTNMKPNPHAEGFGIIELYTAPPNIQKETYVHPPNTSPNTAYPRTQYANPVAS